MAVYRPTYRDPKTGKLKNSLVWWYHFTFRGERVQKSSGSTRKTIAQAAEKNRRLEMERAYSGQGVAEPATHRIRTVKVVLADYARGYGINHRKSSNFMVKNRSAHLERLLGSLMLSDVTPQRITEYMEKRKSEKARGHQVGGRTINLEIQILAAAIGSTWKALWAKVKKLEENHDVGRALETTEEQALMDAASKNQSRLIYPFLHMLAWTGMRSDEARTLRWSQVNFDLGEIVVGKSKSEAGRGRRIPMTANLKAVLGQHAAWYASKAGPRQEEWYVFPHMNRLALKDPRLPVTSLKTAWESVRETAGIKCRLHDLRHSFCTKLAEAGVPEGAMLDMMGHVSTAMLRRYSHIRAQARRDAIDAIESRQNLNVAAKDSAKVAYSEGMKKLVTH